MPGSLYLMTAHLLTWWTCSCIQLDMLKHGTNKLEQGSLLVLTGV